MIWTALYYLKSILYSVVIGIVRFFTQGNILSPFVMIPRVEENFLMDYPEVLIKNHRFNKVDMMFGYTSHEGAMIVQSKLP